ncbi:ABC transporter substrate-binding protein [Oscillatoria sp. FACHB-1407]|uniref:CmpA/NrtA family ABC transporter substrate-binding protein n=1 Tax=Oscillatoria sp. FACHB-1407 TaxID=2692847 RepID=UPI00168A2ACC|nr:CmpA/NrtA family ABC transporter substrate-binding protein [Oscillatoria sp. FACHB-1407]MBD2461311.1 ABC transporter substrate-binding protein [Oscillatoria sp. FACHB-1407]
MSKLSRRRFLYTAGATTAGTILLNACTNPPNPNQQQTTTTASPAVNVGGGEGPEVTTARLGYIPIFESTPIIIAKVKGFFDKYGMTDVQVVKQASWGALRDNVIIGSQGGGLDAAQFQMPMPYFLNEGLITADKSKLPMYVLLQTSTQGNGIAIAGKHSGKNMHLNLSQVKSYFTQLKGGGTPFTAAYTFPGANQELWIRYWLAAGGIDPDADVKLIAVPPPQTVANMKTGTMDGFSTGDPWPYRIVQENIGFMATLTAQIWPAHPEEYFAVRADWADQYPKATKAIMKALMEAQQWVDDPANRDEAIQILSGREYFNLAADILTPPMKGQYNLGDGQPAINDINMGPLFWKDPRGSVSYPYKSHDAWFLTENIRWGMLPLDTDVKGWIDKVNREDLWREAAKEMGIADADIPKETTRGVETFFDGITFDANDPTAYLKSLQIKKVSV